MANKIQSFGMPDEYLEKLGGFDFEHLPESFQKYVKANASFIKKLEKFELLVDCLSADVCFQYWINETKEIIQQSEDALMEFAHARISEVVLVDSHKQLALRIKDIAGRIYEGHWAYGISEETNQQFDDLTEFLRRVWLKENKVWLALARVWAKRFI